MDHSYIAGLFDGEGSVMVITIKEKNKKVGTLFRFRPVIKIAQKNREVLDEIQRYLGFGHVDKMNRKNNGEVHNYIVNGLNGVNLFIDAIAQHSFIKKEALLKCKELIELQKNRSHRLPYTMEELLKTIEIRDSIFKLNSKTRSNMKQKYVKETILKEHYWIKDINEWDKKRMENAHAASKEFYKNNKRQRNLTEIDCECGCKNKIYKYDERGREKKFMQGHNQKGKHWSIIREVIK